MSSLKMILKLIGMVYQTKKETFNEFVKERALGLFDIKHKIVPNNLVYGY